MTNIAFVVFCAVFSVVMLAALCLAASVNGIYTLAFFAALFGLARMLSAEAGGPRKKKMRRP